MIETTHQNVSDYYVLVKLIKDLKSDSLIRVFNNDLVTQTVSFFLDHEGRDGRTTVVWFVTYGKFSHSNGTGPGLVTRCLIMVP